MKIKFWKYFIYLICAIMLIVPYSEIFTIQNEESNGEWLKNYALNTFEIAIIIIPIIFLLILIPRIKNSIAKKISIIILCTLSAFAFIFAFQYLFIPFQDFMPHWGMLILNILFPIVVIDSIIEWKATNKEL